jgi:hypothetical protein
MPIAAASAGAAILLTGIAFKLNHLAGAAILSNAGFVVLVAGLIGLTVSVLRNQ